MPQVRRRLRDEEAVIRVETQILSRFPHSQESNIASAVPSLPRQSCVWLRWLRAS